VRRMAYNDDYNCGRRRERRTSVVVPRRELHVMNAKKDTGSLDDRWTYYMTMTQVPARMNVCDVIVIARASAGRSKDSIRLSFSSVDHGMLRRSLFLSSSSLLTFLLVNIKITTAATTVHCYPWTMSAASSSTTKSPLQEEIHIGTRSFPMWQKPWMWPWVFRHMLVRLSPRWWNWETMSNRSDMVKACYC
jgi:hypothetical protein